MNIAFPLRYDATGRTAQALNDDAHIRDMIEQLLFTSPGERVNRPDLGTGLLPLVFAPNSPELAAATQLTIQGALQRWLGDVIDVRNVDVESAEAVLSIRVEYVVRRTDVRQAYTFVKVGL